jgi:N-acetylmuramoyl-L-alanine amidase
VKRKISHIVIHCAATPPSSDIGVKEIDAWHRKRGWSGIGYHYVIRRNGEIEKGRPDDKVGAHVKGFNSTTLGICLVGGLNSARKATAEYTGEQWQTLELLVRHLKTQHPTAEVLGHRDFPNVNKACPCFDVADWWAFVNETNEKVGT